jgi:PAS domain S-box-containing protein
MAPMSDTTSPRVTSPPRSANGRTPPSREATAELPREIRGASIQPPDYAALVEAAGDFIYTLDLEGRFTFLNQAAARMLGHSVEELLGKKFTVVLSGHHAEVALQHFGRGVAGTETTPFFEVEVLRKDGSSALLEVRAGSLYKDGELIGRQGIGRDISEVRSLQQAIAAKSERLALIEERTRIAMALYARIAEFAVEDTDDVVSSSRALRQMHDAVLRVTADHNGLSQFDVGILQLLAKGCSNREIAVAVHRSPHTIKDHIKKIKERIGVKRRAELVATALKLGLISQER